MGKGGIGIYDDDGNLNLDADDDTTATLDTLSRPPTRGRDSTDLGTKDVVSSRPSTAGMSTAEAESRRSTRPSTAATSSTMDSMDEDEEHDQFAAAHAANRAGRRGGGRGQEREQKQEGPVAEDPDVPVVILQRNTFSLEY